MAKKLGIAAVLVVLAAAAFFWQGRKARVQENRERNEARLLSFDDRAVDGLDIRIHDTDHRLELRDRGWYLAGPVHDRADDDVVADLLSALKRSRVRRTLDQPEGLDSYGLDPPQVRIALRGTPAPILGLGDVIASQDGRFAFADDRAGVLVIEAFPGWPLMLESIDAFRQRTLTEGASGASASLTIRGPGSEVALSRAEDGWWIDRPRRLPASERAVTRLLDGLDAAEVVRFVDGADADDPAFGFANGSSIVFGGPDGTTEVRLGGAAGAGERYASRDDREAILVVPDDGLVDGPRSIESLLAERVTKVNRYHVIEFDYRAGQERYALRREGDVWRRDGADGVVVEDGVAYGWLQRVLEARVDGWAEPPAPGVTPIAELRFTTESGVRDRVAWYPGGLAVLDSEPGFGLHLSRPLPAVP